MRAAIVALLLLVAGMLALPAVAAESGSPFGPRVGAPSAQAEPSSVQLPAALSRLLVKVAEMQSRLNRQLAGGVRNFAQEGAPTAGLIIVAVAFFYGVFHAAGPGHGKLIITSYFLSRDAPVRRGLTMSLMIAVVQAATAVLLVGLLAAVLRLSRFEVLGHALTVELASYALLVAMGLYLGWRAIAGRECCDHGHAHDHDPASAPSPRGVLGRFAGRMGEMPLMAFVVGLRPCSGGIVVLLFSLAHGVFWIGVIAVAAMALGVAITTSLIGIGAIGMRRGLVGLTVGRPGAYTVTMRGVALLGAVAVAASGSILFLAALQRGTLL